MRNDRTLRAIKAVHTLVWLSVESCVAYLLYAGFAGRSDRRAAIAGAVVAGECAVFAANGLRCPLTAVAKSLGAEHGSVTDIYLPTWIARNLPAIHVPLLVLTLILHQRNLRRRKTDQPISRRRDARSVGLPGDEIGADAPVEVERAANATAGLRVRKEWSGGPGWRGSARWARSRRTSPLSVTTEICADVCECDLLANRRQAGAQGALASRLQHMIA